MQLLGSRRFFYMHSNEEGKEGKRRKKEVMQDRRKKGRNRKEWK